MQHVGDGATATVPVERVNVATGGASVVVQFKGGSAQLGSDFNFNSSQLVWGSEQSGFRTALVPITADGLAETTESLVLQLDSPVGAAIINPA